MTKEFNGAYVSNINHMYLAEMQDQNFAEKRKTEMLKYADEEEAM